MKSTPYLYVQNKFSKQYRADILTCDKKKITVATVHINSGFVLFKHLFKPWQCEQAQFSHLVRWPWFLVILFVFFLVQVQFISMGFILLYKDNREKTSTIRWHSWARTWQQWEGKTFSQEETSGRTCFGERHPCAVTSGRRGERDRTKATLWKSQRFVLTKTEAQTCWTHNKS